MPAPETGPVSEASEQTREHPKLAEAAGSDQVASPATEASDFGSNPVMPFEQAMMQVVNSRRRASELVAIEKKFLMALYGLIEKYIPG